uniref:ATP synthase F0 subunit 8 n=1 Tax=Pegasus laternarius TaxID=1888206 RepID=UPI00286CEA72|nr:ATP synthase F0 subunit 8 [Pegasus laternarius]WKY95811.1 ATP synthase F0 subunit 8 [Pegasus laternarius]
MPQLNPSPWFLIMLFCWLIILTTALPKIMQFTTPNEPLNQNTKPLKTTPWNYQWH